MTRVVGYVRVSTEEQASSGCSLAAQEAKIRSYCELYGIDLIEVISDAGQSAKTINRDGQQKALAMLDDGTANGIIISKLDRLTRSCRDWNSLIERYFAGKASLLSVDDKIDTQTASGRVVLNLLVAISQWEREAIGERTSVALRHRMKEGIRVGAPPLGSRIENGRLIKDEAELRAVTLALHLRGKKMAYQRIANELERLNIPTKRGATRWHSETVRQIIRRHSQEDKDGTES